MLPATDRHVLPPQPELGATGCGPSVSSDNFGWYHYTTFLFSCHRRLSAFFLLSFLHSFCHPFYGVQESSKAMIKASIPLNRQPDVSASSVQILSFLLFGYFYNLHLRIELNTVNIAVDAFKIQCLQTKCSTVDWSPNPFYHIKYIHSLLYCRKSYRVGLRTRKDLYFVNCLALLSELCNHISAIRIFTEQIIEKEAELRLVFCPENVIIGHTNADSADH